MFCCVVCDCRLELYTEVGLQPKVVACKSCAQNHLIQLLPEGYLVRFLGRLMPLTTRLGLRPPAARKRTALIILDRQNAGAVVV